MFHTSTQNRNTARLVLTTFYRLDHRKGVTPADITRYLRLQFGGLWRSELTQKAESTLRQCVNLGFLEREGGRYVLPNPGKHLLSSLEAREGCGLGSERKTKCPARRSVSRRRRRAPPSRRRSPARRRRPCVQGRVKKRRCTRARRSPKDDSSNEDQSEPLQLADDDDGSQGSATN